MRVLFPVVSMVNLLILGNKWNVSRGIVQMKFISLNAVSIFASIFQCRQRFLCSRCSIKLCHRYRDTERQINNERKLPEAIKEGAKIINGERKYERVCRWPCNHHECEKRVRLWMLRIVIYIFSKSIEFQMAGMRCAQNLSNRIIPDSHHFILFVFFFLFLFRVLFRCFFSSLLWKYSSFFFAFIRFSFSFSFG